MAPLTGPEFLKSWSALHGTDPDDTPLVRFWLQRVYRCARPVAAAGVSANAVTMIGLLIAVASLAPAAAGGRWALLAAAALALNGVLDGLDGAVAVLRGTSGRWGAVLDALADRLADLAGCLVLLALGAPAPWVAVAAGLGLLHEYLRARAAAAGLAGVGVVTIAERPTRIAVAVMFAVAAGVFPPVQGRWAGAGAGLLVLVGAVGLGHLTVVLRRRLRELDGR